MRLMVLLVWCLSLALAHPVSATIGGVGDCSDAAGSLKLDVAHDGQLRSAAPQPPGTEAPTIPFKERSRVVMERRVSSCISKGCGQAFKVELERYILLIEWQQGAQKMQTYLYCEYAWDASPAGCNCDREVLQEHRVLVPGYRSIGKR